MYLLLSVVSRICYSSIPQKQSRSTCPAQATAVTIAVCCYDIAFGIVMHLFLTRHVRRGWLD